MHSEINLSSSQLMQYIALDNSKLCSTKVDKIGFHLNLFVAFINGLSGHFRDT